MHQTMTRAGSKIGRGAARALTGVGLLLIFVVAIAVPVNAINVIHPYKHEGMWVFDDPLVGLRREPFISGADTMIDKAVADIPNAEKGFSLIFSSTPFPGQQIMLQWRRSESGGDWYYSPELQQEGWLCPALLKYFAKAPSAIYVSVRAKGR
jgi:hypothetical protein